MAVTIAPPPRCRPTGSAEPLRVAQCVGELLSRAYASTAKSERRLMRRYPYPRLIVVTPLDEDDSPAGPSVIACCKDISSGGVGFFHHEPIPYQKVAVTFSRPDQDELSVATVLRWCRFTRRGWYESGGRFLKIVPTPEAAQNRI